MGTRKTTSKLTSALDTAQPDHSGEESSPHEPSELEKEIEGEREEIFLVMNLIDTVKDALGQDDFLSYYEVLGLAHQKLNTVAAHLETIHSGRGSLS